MLIFILQTIWLFIKDLAGKDLDLLVIFKFLLYYSPKLIPLVLPLTILLSSIMVFGSFSENYEFAAMKSTGISLQRAMRSLSIFIVFLAIGTFFFCNNVIPWGEFNSYNLRNNIRKLKPAMAIAEGQFNDIANYNIKVEKKSGDRGQYLHNVIIHKKTPKKNGNYTTIIAENGELLGQEDSEVLQLILNNGYYYDNTPPKKAKDRKKNPMAKAAFEKYTINADFSEDNETDLDSKSITNKYSMLNVTDLSYTIDSLKIKDQNEYANLATNMYSRSQIENLNKGIQTKKDKDTFKAANIINLYSKDQQNRIVDLAISTANSTTKILERKESFLKKTDVNYNKHIFCLHEKFALGFACIVLFFVGAPLGAIIRKGGFGLPIIIAMLLFLTYHFIGIFAKNSGVNGKISPVLAAWLSTLVMLPLGIYLTRRATSDRGLFEFDSILNPIKKVFKKSESAKEKEVNQPKIASIDAILPENYKSVQILYSHYIFYARTTFATFSFGFVFLILHFIFQNNNFPMLTTSSLQLSVTAFGLALIYFGKSWLTIDILYTFTKERFVTQNLAKRFSGIFLYPLTFFLIRNKLNEDFYYALK